MATVCSLRFLLSALFIFTGHGPCIVNCEPHPPAWSNDDLAADASLSRSSLEVAWDGYRALGVPSGENFFYSPYSIINALGMLILGSRGTLERQLKEAMRVPASLTSDQMHQQLSDENAKLISETEATIGVANRFFVDQGSVTHINHEYKADLEEQYKSDLQATTFAEDPKRTQAEINNFVSANTAGQIPNLLDKAPDPATLLMLVNAIYFKGLWTIPFEEKFTKPGPFHAQKGDVTANFMTSKTLLQYANSPELEAEIVALPYTQNETYGMYAILPLEGHTLDSLEDSLDHHRIRQLGQKMHETHIELKIPRFNMKSRFELKNMLQNLGAVGLNEVQSAETSRIFSNPNQATFIDQILHEAAVDVNENGTTAAGATSVGVVAVSLPLYRPVTLNKPFLFFIADNSNGFILFWGRVEDPRSSSSQ